MIAVAPSMDNLKKTYRDFDEWRIAAAEVEVLLVVNGRDMDRSAKAQLVNMYVNIMEGDMGWKMAQVNQTG